MKDDLTSIQPWVEHVCAELGIDPALVDMPPLLDMTKAIAYGVERPAGPVTTFLIGLAVAGGNTQSVAQLSETIAEQARTWKQS